MSFFLCVGISATAAEPQTEPQPVVAPAEVIRYRQTVMRAIASHLKALGPLAAKKVGYPKHVLLHAQAVADLSKTFGELFPKGTGGGGGDSDALDAIWKDTKAWNQSLEKMRTEADKLAGAAVDGDFTALRAQVEAVNDACAACHKSFRAGK